MLSGSSSIIKLTMGLLQKIAVMSLQICKNLRVGHKESRSQIPSPRSSIPNPESYVPDPESKKMLAQKEFWLNKLLAKNKFGKQILGQNLVLPKKYWSKKKFVRKTKWVGNYFGRRKITIEKNVG